MTSYVFILGRTPDLAFSELKTFLPDVVRVHQFAARAPSMVPIEKLGGTVKIAQIVDALNVAPGSTFGISVYGGPQVSLSALQQMKKQFHAARFVAARGEPLSSVVIAKNKLDEFIIIQDKNIVARTVAVQNFEEWNARDYGRPFADPKAGMLPPKVSRMVVNIADRSRDAAHALAQKTLLDPFCGMGTILSEALVMGWNVVGGDQSEDVIAKARKNLQWLIQKHPDLGVTYRLNVADAVHISSVVDKESVDAIVTEPFMGAAQTPSRGSVRRMALPGGAIDVKNTIKGLEKLYIGCLRDWHRVLKPHGVVMMALPMYAVNGKTYFVKKVIDMCETLGYTIEEGPIEYSRPQAMVKRVFYLFKKI